MDNSQVQIGKVLKVTRKTYTVEVNGCKIPCVVRGKLADDNSDYGAVRVGDNVRVRFISSEEGAIEEILPRRSRFSRVIESRAYSERVVAVNIDQILIVVSTRQPKFSSGLLDRYLVLAARNKLDAVICLNKIDLDDPEKFSGYREYYQQLGFPFLLTSAVTGEGVEELKDHLKDKVTAMAGHSGVGKSSLAGRLQPGLDIAIHRISERTQKGQHTTTSVELLPLSFGGYLADTPGIRELGLWKIYKRDLQEYFVEFQNFRNDCRFADCQHLKEPGCAVKSAVERQDIFPERYQNYVRIYESLKAAHYE